MQRKQVPVLRGRRHHRALSRWDDYPSPETGDSDGVGMLPSEQADEDALLTGLAWQWGPLGGYGGLMLLVVVAGLRLGAGVVRDLLRRSGPPHRRREHHVVHGDTTQGR